MGIFILVRRGLDLPRYDRYLSKTQPRMSQKETSETLSSHYPLSKIPSEVVDSLGFVQQQNGVVAIACSGGADSVFLARWYAAFFPEHLDNFVYYTSIIKPEVRTPTPMPVL